MSWRRPWSVAAPVRALLAGCLEADPALRIPDGAALRDAVRRARAGRLPLAAKGPARLNPRRALPGGAAVAALVAAVALVAALAAGLPGAVEPPEAAPAPTADHVVPRAAERPLASPGIVAAAPSGPLRGFFVDPPTGAIVPRYTEAEVVNLAWTALKALRTAELSYDVAFDGYGEDFEALGWQPAPPYRYYLAFRVELASARPLRALVTRGPARGRLFVSDIERGDLFEIERLAEADVREFVVGDGWIGNADAAFGPAP